MPVPSRNIRLRFPKILFYLISFSLLLLACQQEEVSDTSFGEDSENDDIILSINNLTSRDIQENVKLNTAVKEINEITISNYTTRSTNSESNDSEPKDTSPVQLEYATEIISSKNNTFTFQLAKKAGAQDDSAVYNIVFIEQDEGDFQAIGVKYDFSEDQAEIFYNTGQIDGEVRVIFFSIKDFKDKPKYTTRSVFAGNICDNIEGGMDCGSLDEVIINGGGGSDRAGIGDVGGNGDDSREGGDVDFETAEPVGLPGGGYTIPVVNKSPNKIIIDTSFKDNKCLNGVYTSMRQNLFFNKFLEEFDDKRAISDLLFRTDTPHKNSDLINEQGKIRRAVTSHDSKKKEAIITINGETLDRPTLSIATTIMHEVMHAHMLGVLWEYMTSSVGSRVVVNFDKSDLEANKNNFGTILEYYDEYKRESEIGVQHELMADKYISWMTANLAVFAKMNHI